MLDSIFPSLSTIASITGIGAVFGLMLSVAKLKLRVERDPRFDKILELLPNANCGACGQPGCAGYAAKIIEGEVEITLCPAAGAEAVQGIADLMGIEATAQKPQTARIHCHGSLEVINTSFIYNGPRSCTAAQQIMEGFKVCKFGCLGLGDCVKSCPFDAIHIDGRGLPLVDMEKCTGCGNCVEACPREIISLLDKDYDVYVLCKNREKAPIMKRGCSVGCIACKRCVKACKEIFEEMEIPEAETAIDVEGFLAIIDYDKCIDCGKCAEVCPQNVIAFKDIP